MNFRLDYYTAADLKRILARTCGILGIGHDDAGLLEIARRSRGTPRVANNLIRWVRDYAQVKGHRTITGETSDAALKMLEIDSDGLDGRFGIGWSDWLLQPLADHGHAADALEGLRRRCQPGIDAGLVTPVIRDAGARDVWNIGAEAMRLAAAARDRS